MESIGDLDQLLAVPPASIGLTAVRAVSTATSAACLPLVVSL
jgi:hypothetical protein